MSNMQLCCRQLQHPMVSRGGGTLDGVDLTDHRYGKGHAMHGTQAMIH